MKFEGKSALITGATGGIGKAIAECFIQGGAKVMLSGTDSSKLDILKEQLMSRYSKAQIFTKPCNLKDKAQIIELVKEAQEKLQKLDTLIANAGITKDNLIIRMQEQDWDDVLDINLKSTFLLSKETVKTMLKQRHGRIILISSVVGLTGNPGQVNYCASKAGLIGFAKSLALETASRNITVNCVAPGFIKSPMTDALNETQTASILGKIPAGRYGSPEDVASVVSFLTSDCASYITGQTISVNGGLHM